MSKMAIQGDLISPNRKVPTDRVIRPRSVRLRTHNASSSDRKGGNVSTELCHQLELELELT
jgi:hypothetical protein